MRISGTKHLQVSILVFTILFPGKAGGLSGNEQNITGFSTDEVHISEIMASNASVLKDEDGDYSDLIEISNPTSGSVSLYNWFLTDDLADPFKW